MKLRINQKTLAAMPVQVAEIVKEWSARHGKAFVSVENRPSVYIREDGRYTAINLLNGAEKSARAGGEWAGMGDMTCNTTIPLPAGCVMVEQGFFCGFPFLNIFQGQTSQVLPDTRRELQRPSIEFERAPSIASLRRPPMPPSMEDEADDFAEQQNQNAFETEPDYGGVLAADGNVYSDADPGL